MYILHRRKMSGGLEVKKETVKLLLGKGIIVDGELMGELNKITDMISFNGLLSSDRNVNQGNIIDMIDRYTKSNDISAPISSVGPKIPIISSENSNVKKGVVNIVFSYEGEPKKRDAQDFVGYFTARYNALRKILMARKEMASPTSINRLSAKGDREEVAVIGLISDKQVTKNNNIILTIEDLTGEIKVLLSHNKKEIEEAASLIVLDEVIGIVGNLGDNIIFANNVLFPDIPLSKELKKAPEEVYAVFIGDTHFGSNMFLHNSFDKFLNWLKGNHGSEVQRVLASKVQYLFIVGDLVEGVGIHPHQEETLDIKDIYAQYNAFAELLKGIPDHIQVIVCAGNHDAMRIAEPQPPLYKDFAEAVWNIPNINMVSNPSIVNIHSSDVFEGFDILIYHGFSFIYYSEQIESIRSLGGQKRVDMIMKALIQKRHLAPSHKSTLYLPDADKDSLVIDSIPDFFVSGHIHRVSATNYRNVTLLNCSSWLSSTEYQDKMGLEPQPGRALLANLQTRKIKILNFFDEDKENKKNKENQENQEDTS